MSDPVAIALITGCVTALGAIVTGAVAIVKLWNEVKGTDSRASLRTAVETIPAHVTEEAEKTRAVVTQAGVTAARLAGDGSPDDVAAGAIHTHQRKARPEV